MVLNLSNQENRTEHESLWLEEVFKAAKLSIDKHVEIDSRLFRPHEVPHLLGDYTKAKEVLGWEPEVNFKKLAKLMYKSDLKLCKKEKK